VSEAEPKKLDECSREELISRATELGVTRPNLLTRVELRDEIVRLTETDEQSRQRARGWLGAARDLVASVVEQKLNLPDAADLIRGVNVRMPKYVPPVATVTLAEIYAAQGHVARAVKLLDEVLGREPDHDAARELRERLVNLPEPELAPNTSPSVVPEEPQFSEVPLATAAEVPEVVEVHPQPTVSVPEVEVPVVAEAQLEPVAAVLEVAESAFATVDVAQETKPDFDRDYLIYRRHDATVVCHWSVTSKTWERWSARRDGQWVLRVVQVTPALGPLETAETLVPLPGTTGEAMLNDLAARQQVRMAIGWDSAGRFIPVAIGIEVAGTSADEARIAWLPVPGPGEPAPEVWLDCARRAWSFLAIGTAP
jgi:hypothetical protein